MKIENAERSILEKAKDRSEECYPSLESIARILRFKINPERGFLRSFSDEYTRKPAQFFLDIGLSPNKVTILGGVLNVGGQIAAFHSKTISKWVSRFSMGWINVSPEAIRKGGAVAEGAGLGLDLEDGAMTKLPGQQATHFGAVLDHALDRIGGSTSPTMIMVSKAATQKEVVAAEDNLFLASAVSEVRADGERYGIKIREISIGSMLLRIPGMIGAVVSEKDRAYWLDVVSIQSSLTIAERLWMIYRSGNKDAFNEAIGNLAFNYGIYRLTRLGAGRSLTRALITQAAAIGPSIYSKIRKVNGN